MKADQTVGQIPQISNQQQQREGYWERSQIRPAQTNLSASDLEVNDVGDAQEPAIPFAAEQHIGDDHMDGNFHQDQFDRGQLHI
jgi:hypothetical protein